MSKALDPRRGGVYRAVLRAGIAVSLALSSGFAIPASAQTAAPRDLTQFSLEDLMNVEVTSVSKKEQKLAKTGAAIFVITQEDIRRSGATNIPDLLRMVPGVNVARVDHSDWAVSIRGFNDLYANKVLVLIDGRSVYHPVYSGVLWYAQDVPLEDIERIEVIRGPGGTVWGANAMNGVINIITKSAKATAGGLISAGGGSKQQAEGLLQFGGQAGKSGNYRVFGRYSNLGNSDAANSLPPADARRLAQGGFRADWDLSQRDALTVEGEIRRADGRETLTGVLPETPTVTGTYTAPIGDYGGSILGRLTHTFLNGSDVSLQASFEKSQVFGNEVHDWSRVGNIDFEHHLHLGSRNDLVWGLSYRVAFNRFAGNNATTLNPLERTDALYSAFAQDEISLSKTLSLTLGSKFEHNAYTGYESEPSAQLVWAPNLHHTVWASAAKAIRQPSNIDSGLETIVSVVPLPQQAIGLVTVFGNPNAKVEQLHDFETGYRTQINRRLSLDVTGFLSFYKHLETSEPGLPFFAFAPAPPHLVIPLVFDYKAHAKSYGAEAFASWNVTNRWRLSPGLTMLNMSVRRDLSSNDPAIGQAPGYSPRRSYQVRSFINLGRSFEWDQTVGYTGRLAVGDIPGYIRMDTRFGWRMGEFLELSVVGQNLLQPRHVEFPKNHFIEDMSDQRSVFGKITWRF